MTNAITSLPRLRISLVREPESTYEPLIRHSGDVCEYARDMASLDREEFRIYLLDAKHHITALHTVSIGHLTSSLVHPREVFKAAILANAAALIAVHNHPSGDPTPSQEDHALTQRLINAGSLMGIELLDHVIIGHPGSYSFADHGVLPKPSNDCLNF